MARKGIVYVGALCVLLCASSASGEDAGAVAATLSDAAAECQYLTLLCLEGRNALVDPGLSVRQKIDKIGKAADAARVIRAKHETMPRCFTVCEGLLDMSGLQ